MDLRLVMITCIVYCFILGSGLYNNKEFNKLVEPLKESKRDVHEIDISTFLSENFNSLNKTLRTVFKFSKEFQIIDTKEDVRVRFIWKKFKIQNEFPTFPGITPVQNRTLFDEDDVTYISVHNVLKQNGYKIIAVSYPGAQGDRVVLAEAGTGRSQQRRYIDIISYLPKSHSALQENKGKFSPTSIQAEIIELSKYKKDKGYKKSIENLFDRFDKQAPKVFKIGVGFWANSKFTVKHIQQITIDSLDYFIYIKANQKDWIVFDTGKSKLFSTTTGKIVLPKVYEVSKFASNQLGFFETEI
ncbi:MAG: hypothetical protein KKG06_00680 [Bacteroidetes bacterium]|nr:hypothetical protein [Bacteroidota bacterium]MBU1421694.1 hypothetical protein [Bacteroidota bacterium]